MSDDETAIDPSVPVSRIAKVLVALLILLAIGFAGTMWWFSHRDAPARALAEKFIRAMDKGDLNSARSLCTADIDFEEMQRIAKRMTQEWGEIHLLDLSGVRPHPQGDGTIHIDIAGQLEYDNDLRKAFTATIIQQPDGSMKISSYKFE